jgi:pimeloyl-ACP methyl ester carboxylesterase
MDSLDKTGGREATTVALSKVVLGKEPSMASAAQYRIHDVPVDGGALRVGEWGPGDPGGPTILAVHGITGSHLAWAAVAQAMPEARLIAPDLRGRGRSAALPGPCGMARHTADLEAVTKALDLPRAVLVGHSMGAFVAVFMAQLYPDRFSEVLLVDGGLPLAIPAGISKDDLLTTTLGPAAARLSMTFPDRATYLEFWKAHPAFASGWSQAMVDYAEYDLTGTAPQLRSSCSFEAVRQDSTEIFDGAPVLAALADLTARRQPVTLMTAPRGLLDDTPGLYSPSEIQRWRAELPAVTIREVPDVNHYTIVMGSAGASAIARELHDHRHQSPGHTA